MSGSQGKTLGIIYHISLIPKVHSLHTKLGVVQSTLCSAQQVYYWEADSRNETEKMKVLFLPEPVVKIKDLTSHTKYLVSISAFNAAGDGPKSDPCQGRTHQAGRSSRLFYHSIKSQWYSSFRRVLTLGPGYQPSTSESGTLWHLFLI